MISHELRCILVHVQKTGGMSIRRALNMQQWDPHQHRFASELRTLYGPELWQGYFKFGFVRNPWDRLVSWWEMIRRNVAEGRPMNEFQRYVLSNAATFEDFICKCGAEYRDRDGSKWIYRNQVDYLTDSSGAPLVDFIGRFENLPADFGFVAGRLGLKAGPIPHINRSNRRVYAEYYTDELRDIVAHRYARDIAAFGYEFGERCAPS